MRQKLEKIRDLIDEVLKELSDHEIRPLSREEEFSFLKGILDSQEWPKAVPETQIADEDSEDDKDERSEGIVDIILPSLSGKRFLDFGCGEGHVANHVAKSAAISVGYDRLRDPRSRFSWEEENDNLFLTTDFKAVESRGPYDLVLMYDVLDHAQGSTPKDMLKMVGSVLADGGRVYLRNHPWCGRHGGHLYRKINKAFVHVVFGEDELKEMGLEPESNAKALAPISVYSSWIEGSGLKNSGEPILEKQEVEPFFRDNPIVKGRLLKAFGRQEWTDACPVWQMSQCFWDYVLEKE